jgi:hypothetical protein
MVEQRRGDQGDERDQEREARARLSRLRDLERSKEELVPHYVALGPPELG